MSIVTKIFVIAVTFLAIVQVALIVPYVAKTENFQQEINSTRGRLRSAETRAEQLQSDNSQLQADEGIRILNTNATIEALKKELTTLAADLSTATNDVLAEKARGDMIDASRIAMDAALRQMTSIVTANQSELDMRRKQMIENQTRMIQLVQRNDELSTDVEAAGREVRRLREQMAAANEKVREYGDMIAQLPPVERDRLRGGSAGGPDDVRTTATQVRGKITTVAPLEDETLVAIDVGRNDTVTPNTKFWIQRAGNYIGSLVVIRSDANESAARVANLVPNMEVRVGDEIFSGPYQQ